MLVGAVVLLGVMKLLQSNVPPAPPKKPDSTPPAAQAPRDQPTRLTLELPPPEDYTALTEPERAALTRALRDLADRVGVSDLPEPATAESLLAAIDAKLGTPDARRDPGPLRTFGPPRRQLQALLWKHQVAGYDDTRLNPAELVERLSRQVAKKDPP